MTNTLTYKMPFKRRLAQKTNYKKRFALLKTNSLRAVIRKSNSNTLVAIVEYDKAGDKTIAFATTAELKGFGWAMNTGNIPAAYLCGLLAGMRAKAKGVKSAVPDIGLYTPVHKSRIFAALKGVVDGGISLPHDEAVFPSNDRISGKHLKESGSQLFEKVKREIENGENK